jgi:Mce-associated membrane protein
VTGRRRQPALLPLLVCVLLALVSLGLATAGLLLGGRALERSDTARAEALEAARERGARLTTYDHRTLDADVAAVLETATGDFEQEYRTATEELRPVFEQTQAVAVGEVVAAGLESAQVDGGGPERAVAVLAVDQVIRTTGASPRTEHNRIRMVLVRPEDTWLVERVERL